MKDISLNEEEVTHVNCAIENYYVDAKRLADEELRQKGKAGEFAKALEEISVLRHRFLKRQ